MHKATCWPDASLDSGSIPRSARLRALTFIGPWLIAVALVLVTGACRASPPFSFQNVTATSLDTIANSNYRFDAMWTDFNGDGCYDAWIFDHENPATSRLWVNRCDGSDHFELASNSQVHYYIADPELPRGSGWVTLVDFNGDGRQDFWTWDYTTLAARYVNGTPAGAHTPLFTDKQAACNEHCIVADINGDDRLDIVHENRAIEDALSGSSIAPAAGQAGYRNAADLNGDGWVDLLQPAAGGYWKNNAGNLSWVSVPGLVGTTNLMAMTDLDNDGDTDILTMSEPKNGVDGMHVYRNNGNGSFTDVTAASGLAGMHGTAWWTGYGNLLTADLDNDGLQDVLVAGASYAPQVTVIHNLGNMHFAITSVDLGPATAGSESAKSRASVADFDNDGRLDVLKTQTGTNAGIWRNTTNTGSNRWMKVRVRGEGLNSDGLGADVRWYKPGTTTLLAHLQVQASNQHPQTWLATGVGPNSTADLVITWPHGGPSHRYTDLDTNQEVIAYPNGCLLENWQPGNEWPLDPPGGCTQPQDTGPPPSPPPPDPGPDTGGGCGNSTQTVARDLPGDRSGSRAERAREAAVRAGKIPQAPPAGDCIGG